jgi:hypothetical protein
MGWVWPAAGRPREERPATRDVGVAAREWPTAREVGAAPRPW